ncbi:MAG: PEP/pyruvate-binding domain-containing protein, partial [Balneolaceae bacterium]
MNKFMTQNSYVRWYNDLDMSDIDIVGGKNASLGEMIKNLTNAGIKIPRGFATTAYAYKQFIKVNDLEQPISKILTDYQSGEISLEVAGLNIRKLILNRTFPIVFAESIGNAYDELSKLYNKDELGVAVRSSATAEDLPQASFAG